MLATYKMNLEIIVKHELDELKDLKSDREMAECICQMIADEATMCGAVASYEILKSSLDVK